MPMLPTFEVTDQQAQRLLNAFGSDGDTVDQIIEKYLDWLRQQLLQFVINAEMLEFREQMRIMEQQIRDDILGIVRPPDPEPPVPPPPEPPPEA